MEPAKVNMYVELCGNAYGCEIFGIEAEIYPHHAEKESK